MARLLQSKGVGNVTPKELQETLGCFGLEGEDAEDVLMQIFTRYVLAMCQNSSTKTSEIKELSELRETLGLSGLLMGEALYQVCMIISFATHGLPFIRRSVLLSGRETTRD